MKHCLGRGLGQKTPTHPHLHCAARIDSKLTRSKVWEIFLPTIYWSAPRIVFSDLDCFERGNQHDGSRNIKKRISFMICGTWIREWADGKTPTGGAESTWLVPTGMLLKGPTGRRRTGSRWDPHRQKRHPWGSPTTRWGGLASFEIRSTFEGYKQTHNVLPTFTLKRLVQINVKCEVKRHIITFNIIFVVKCVHVWMCTLQCCKTETFT